LGELGEITGEMYRRGRFPHTTFKTGNGNDHGLRTRVFAYAITQNMCNPMIVEPVTLAYCVRAYLRTQLFLFKSLYR
jgi:hypothetical protein